MESNSIKQGDNDGRVQAQQVVKRNCNDLLVRNSDVVGLDRYGSGQDELVCYQRNCPDVEEQLTMKEWS